MSAHRFSRSVADVLFLLILGCSEPSDTVLYQSCKDGDPAACSTLNARFTAEDYPKKAELSGRAADAFEARCAKKDFEACSRATAARPDSSAFFG